MSMDVFSFEWSVPLEEGVTYTVTLEAHVKDDRVPGNNEVTLDVTSMKHGVRMTSTSPVSSAHGGDDLSYPVLIENIGTFESENATLSSTLPPGWTGTFYHLGNPVDFIIVEDSVNLTYVTSSPFDEEDGDYLLNLSTTAASAKAWLDLTATILRPDLIVEDIALYRADGVRTNDTLHGVDGDKELLGIKVTNTGPTYSTAFNLTIKKDGNPIQEYSHTGLGVGESVWFYYDIVTEAGVLNINAYVDSNTEVPEVDEDNNNLSRDFTIKTIEPVGDFELTGVVRNIFGEGVDLAEVNLEWSDMNITLFTDENGSFSHIIGSGNYSDTMVLYINATDGKNLTSVSIILYSEDGGRHLFLTLNQYLVEITGADTVSSIETGGDTLITVEVTNRGNTNATFILVASELPDDWTVQFQGLTDGKTFLSVNETTEVVVQIHASSDPLNSQGYKRYFLTIMVFAEVFPEANDSYSHGVEVEPRNLLVVTTIGDNTTDSLPFEEVSFQMTVENQGNIDDTLIPELIGGSVEDYRFDINFVALDISESSQFMLWFTMPYIPSGDTIEFEIGSVDEHTQNALLQARALDYHRITCDYPTQLSAAPDDVLSIPLVLTNTGNLQDNIHVEPWSPRNGLGVSDDDLPLDMQTETTYFMEVTMPSDAASGEIIPIFINLTMGGNFFLNLSLNITTEEVYGMLLTLLETTIIPEIDYTVYHYTIDARNTGNGENTFHFRAVGSHTHYMILPPSLNLQPDENTTIITKTIVPRNQTSVIENYLVPTDGFRDYSDINLRILSYSPKIITDLVTYQVGDSYMYDVTVTNNGTRYERISLQTNLPKVSNYLPGDKRWEGGTNKDVLELMPGESDSFLLTVKAPEFREYWGSELTVTLQSATGKSQTLTLPKPPIAILGTTLPTFITIEDKLTFTGSQSYWNVVDYLWDFGDGNNANGSTVSYSYNTAGEFTLTLTVVDDNGFNASKSIDILVDNMEPIVMLVTTPSNRTVEVDGPITFDASITQDRDGSIVGYTWDFGHFGEFYDGILPVIEHSYDQTGSYDVTLTVTDNLGATVNTTITVNVIPKTEKPQNGDQTPPDEITTSKMSYAPAIAVIVVLLAGIALMIQKKSLIGHMKEKIDQSESMQKIRK